MSQPLNTTGNPTFDVPLRTQLISDALGPWYIAVIVFTILYGMSTVQSILYFQRSGKDPLPLKLTMVTVWCVAEVGSLIHAKTSSRLLNSGLLGVVIYSGWAMFVVNAYAVPVVANTASWALAVWYLLAGISDLLVYSVLIGIVWTMADKKTWLLWVLITPSLPGYAGIIAYTYFSFNNIAAISEKRNAWTWYLPYVAHAFIDIVLCVTLTTKLIKMHTGYKNSDFVIRILVTWSVNSGFLASTLIITSIILYAVEPQSNVCKTVASSLSQVVLNSLLALLNTREYRQRILNERHRELKLSITPLPEVSMQFAPNVVIPTNTTNTCTTSVVPQTGLDDMDDMFVSGNVTKTV
ncbi:hypothetical protein BC629DRAFT_877188 [Irpex lacteus]|nr:hypothetical protein BC629DRAFT_877188 [Irpex lacteus]